jgi:hypothetical protein
MLTCISDEVGNLLSNSWHVTLRKEESPLSPPLSSRENEGCNHQGKKTAINA